MNYECADVIVVKEVIAPIPTVLNAVGSIHTWKYTVCDPQIVVLSLYVLGVRFMYVRKVPRDTLFSAEVNFITNSYILKCVLYIFCWIKCTVI